MEGKRITGAAEDTSDFDELDGDFAGVHDCVEVGFEGRCGMVREWDGLGLLVVRC